MLLNADLDMTANQPDPEIFINTWLLAAFLLLVRWPMRRRYGAAMLLGALLAAATLYKHNTAVACAALLLGHVIVPRSRRLLHRAIEAVIACAIICAIWGLVFAYFAALHRSAAFVDVLFNQNMSYSGSMARNLSRSVDFFRIFPRWMIWMIAPVILLTVLIFFSIRNRKTRPSPEWLLLLAWAIGTWPTIALTGYMSSHYYQLWIPIGCIAGGWAGAALVQSPRQVPPIIGFATIIVAFGFLAFRQGSEFLLSPQEWITEQFPAYNLYEQNQLGRDIGRVLKPDEYLWELGDDNALYFFSKHSPPTGLLFIDPFMYGKEVPAYWNRLLRDLNRNTPAVVVLQDSYDNLFPPDAPIFPWLKQNYKPWNTPIGWPNYHLLVRRGSELEKRIQMPS